MARREDSHEQADFQHSDDITKIASSIGTKAYFLSQQERNLDEWADRANQIFRYTGQVLRTQYEIKSSSTLASYANDYDNDFARCKKQFDAFCILNRKVQKKNDEIQNLANHLSQKNTKKTFFQGWRQYTDKNKYIRRMQDMADKYKKHRVLKAIMKSWLSQTMDSNKTKIKNQVLQKTQIQVARIQNQYERLIKSLEQTLEKKLSELKKEEEEHKLLHDKYEAMYSRAPTQKV